MCRGGEKAAWASAWGYSTFTELIIRNFHCNRRCLTGNKEKQNSPTLGSHSLYSRLPVVRKIHSTYRRCKTLPGLLTLVIIRSMNMLWFCHKPVKRVIWLGSAAVCAADFLLALCGIYRTWGQGHCSQHKLKTKPRRWNRSGVTEAEVIIFVSFQKQSNKRAHAGECGRSNDALAELQLPHSWLTGRCRTAQREKLHPGAEQQKGLHLRLHLRLHHKENV